MKTMDELFPVDPDAISVRMTGRTVAEWEAVWQGRRAKALRDRKLTGLKTYTLDERETAIRFYDLDPGDFEPVVAKVGASASLPEELRGLDVVRIEEGRAQNMIDEHRATAERQGQSCPPLAAIVLFRLRQSTLSRIAAEPRPT